MKKPYEITLELFDNDVKIVGILPFYTQGDAETMPLLIRLLIDGVPLEPPPGALATLNFVADDLRWPRTQALQSDGTLLYEVQPEDVAIPGKNTVSVTAVAGGEILTWQGFTYTVADSLADGQTEPPDYLEPWVVGMTTRMSGLETRLAQLPESLHIDENGHLIAVAVVPPALYVNEAGHLIYGG